MSSPPLTGFQAAIDRVADPHVKLLFNLAFNRLGNHAQAFGIQQATINALKSSTTATGGVTVVGGGGGGGVPATSGIFTVNDQSGETAYTTQPGDNGALIVLSDASPIALTLAGSALPYGVIVTNQGAGTVTVTPAAPPGGGSSTISYAGNPGASSMPLPSGQMAILAYDGVNWTAAIEVMPQTFSPVLHEFLTGYNAATGAFSAAQPAFTDISGSLAAGQLPAGVPVVSFGTGAPGGSSTEGYLYFDTTGSPYHGYVWHSGAWNQFS